MMLGDIVCNMMGLARDIVVMEGNEYLHNMKYYVSPALDTVRKSGYLYGADGVSFYYEYYINKDEKAAVFISHGLCEFTSKYEEVIYKFLKEGYSVFIMDYRGHGYSDRAVGDLSKVYIDTFDKYVNDAKLFVENIVYTKSLSGNIMMFAHSMGGTIGALLLEEYPELFKCAVLSSPMFEINFGKFSKGLASALAVTSRLLHFGKAYAPGQHTFDGKYHFETSSTCLSEARYFYIFQKRLADKNYRTCGATYGWSDAGIKAIKKLHKNSYKVLVPVLVFQAGMDSLVMPKGQRCFANNTVNTQLKIIKAAKHEIYNASLPARVEYYKEIFEFYEKYL